MIRELHDLLDPAGRGLLRAQVALIVAYGALQGVAFVLLVPILGALLDDDGGRASRWLLALAAVTALACAAFYAQAMLGHRLGGEVARAVHRRLGEHLVSLPLGWFGPERDRVELDERRWDGARPRRAGSAERRCPRRDVSPVRRRAGRSATAAAPSRRPPNRVASRGCRVSPPA